MPAVTIRNLSEETHRALKTRAAQHDRSAEAEIRDILDAAVRPAGRVKLRSLLGAIGREAGLSEQDVAALQNRDKRPSSRCAWNDPGQYERHCRAVEAST